MVVVAAMEEVTAMAMEGQRMSMLTMIIGVCGRSVSFVALWDCVDN
jgi:hypothetical protein